MEKLNWYQWNAEDHILAAQRLVEEFPGQASALALAQIHATLGAAMVIQES